LLKDENFKMVILDGYLSNNVSAITVSMLQKTNSTRDELEQKIRNIEAVNQLAGYLDSLRVNAENAKQFIAKEEAYLAEKEML